jgi:hypothetical protein
MGRKIPCGFDVGDVLIPALIMGLVILLLVAVIKSSRSTLLSNGVSKISEMLEGFNTTPNVTLKCPQDFTFFNDAAGASFCCKGEVNPYSHTCTAQGSNTMCAFAPNAPDPRGGGGILPLCGAVIDATNATARANFCPSRLQNYASQGKCCASATSVDGTDCSPLDLADKNMYCVIADAKPGEQLCANLKMAEVGVCPAGLRKIGYELGERERARYGAATDGVIAPVCLGIDAVCIPDEAITELKKKGIYGDKDIAKWKYSCSGYNTTVVRRDTTVEMDNTYV